LAKKKWYAKLTNLFSKLHTYNHINSRTTTRSPSRTVTHTTSRTAIRTPTRTVTRNTSRNTSRTTLSSNFSPINHTRTRTTQKTYNHTKSNSKSVRKPYATQKSTGKKKIYKLNKLRPKGTILFKEDFKCIFCFQLPRLPADAKRGIVICPHCGHPAHADEFRSWLKISNLCSRCNRPISNNFIQNIEIIPTAVYIKAMKINIKKGRK
jgi:hypothetical protein